jgi:hypothetical protein
MAQVGQQVEVDLSGLSVPGIDIGAGVSSTGVITQIDNVRGLIQVRLSVAFGDSDNVWASPDKVRVIQ